MNPLDIIPLVKRLYETGEIDFTDEGPELLGQQVVIAPRSLFTQLIKQYQDNPPLEYAIYTMMKQSVYDFSESLSEDVHMEPAELLRTLLKLTTMNGYGHIEINDYDEDAYTARFFVRNLPSEGLENTTHEKGDTYWAGMLAGGMSYVFDQTVDGLETQCVLEEGHDSCRFVVGPTETLQEKWPNLYEHKIGQHLQQTL